MERNYNLSEKAEQQFLQINKDITYLLELVNDPKKYRKLIEILDPTVDRLNGSFTELQDGLSEELNKKIKEFEIIVKPLDNTSTISESEPPDFLPEDDKATWRKLATSGAAKRELADFKQELINNFKNKMFKKLKIDELTKQNLAIRKILEKIRRTLLI